MSDEILIGGTILLIALFAGEPDISDAIYEAATCEVKNDNGN